MNVTVLANPHAKGSATTLTLEPYRSVPSIDLVQVRPGQPDEVVVNLHFPEGQTGVVQIATDGTVIGRSQVVGGQPDMHVDFLEVPLNRTLEAGNEITVTLYRDSNDDGQYEEPFEVQGEPISRYLTVSSGVDPTTNPPRETSTSTPGPSKTSTATTETTTPEFGPILVGFTLVFVAVRRWRVLG